MSQAAAVPAVVGEPLLGAAERGPSLSLPTALQDSSVDFTGKDNLFLPLCFPEKLWKMLESDQFRSIWWSEGGKCVAINKDLFEVEVLGRGVCQRVFNTQHIRSVIRQLNLYGFTKVQRDCQRSASLPEFLSEEAAASAHSQVQQLLCTATNACDNLGGRGTFTANKALP
uniref:HSF-type DNA-binding domain-containing protein n=1 Tax=Junco hyemalis TaxID=40217 RepID=A0A8C5J7M9_JUNHY